MAKQGDGIDVAVLTENITKSCTPRHLQAGGFELPNQVIKFDSSTQQVRQMFIPASASDAGMKSR
jgi:hypothetical protein